MTRVAETLAAAEARISAKHARHSLDLIGYAERAGDRIVIWAAPAVFVVRLSAGGAHCGGLLPRRPLSSARVSFESRRRDRDGDRDLDLAVDALFGRQVSPLLGKETARKRHGRRDREPPISAADQARKWPAHVNVNVNVDFNGRRLTVNG